MPFLAPEKIASTVFGQSPDFTKDLGNTPLIKIDLQRAVSCLPTGTPEDHCNFATNLLVNTLDKAVKTGNEVITFSDKELDGDIKRRLTAYNATTCDFAKTATGLNLIIDIYYHALKKDSYYI